MSSESQAKFIRRAVRDAIAAKGLDANAVFASKLKPKPRWMPDVIWRGMLRMVLKEPPARPDTRFHRIWQRALRVARGRLRAHKSLTGGVSHP